MSDQLNGLLGKINRKIAEFDSVTKKTTLQQELIGLINNFHEQWKAITDSNEKTRLASEFAKTALGNEGKLKRLFLKEAGTRLSESEQKTFANVTEIKEYLLSSKTNVARTDKIWTKPVQTASMTSESDVDGIKMPSAEKTSTEAADAAEAAAAAKRTAEAEARAAAQAEAERRTAAAKAATDAERAAATTAAKLAVTVKRALVLPLGTTSPTIATEDNAAVGYYPYLTVHAGKRYHNPNIKIEIPNITAEEFAALKQTLAGLSEKYTNNTTSNPDSLTPDQLASYCKVYAESSIADTNDANKFTFKIRGTSAFDVSLKPGQGIAVTFADKPPSTQAIAAAAGVLHDVVGTYALKTKVVVGLVIRDYADSPIVGLAIYCSLMCQTAAVRFDPVFTKDDPLGTKKLAELLQELAKTTEGKDQMLGLVEDDNTKLKILSEWAGNNPNATVADLMTQLKNGAAPPSNNSLAMTFSPK